MMSGTREFDNVAILSLEEVDSEQILEIQSLITRTIGEDRYNLLKQCLYTKAAIELVSDENSPVVEALVESVEGLYRSVGQELVEAQREIKELKKLVLSEQKKNAELLSRNNYLETAIKSVRKVLKSDAIKEASSGFTIDTQADQLLAKLNILCETIKGACIAIKNH